jgi:hypothetical protein
MESENEKVDCYHTALPGEPRFTLLARDPEFAHLVMQWAAKREAAVLCGVAPDSDLMKVQEARALARAGRDWRKQRAEFRRNAGFWR